jgi:hypothetical protein
MSSLFDQLAILSVFVVCRVDTQEPKPPGQGAEVHVQQEERRTFQGLRPASDDNVESVLVPQPAPRGDGNLRHQEVSHLGQGHAGTLDEVPDRGSRVVSQVQLAAVTATARKEEPQGRVNAQPNHAWRHGGRRIHDRKAQAAAPTLNPLAAAMRLIP